MQPVLILVVDDEPSIRELLVEDFEFQGYRALSAGSGNEAFRLIEREPVDLVISDVRMADGSGFDLLKKIQARDPGHPPLILITGYSDTPESEALASGAVAVFFKPFERAALMTQIRDLLAKSGRLAVGP